MAIYVSDNTTFKWTHDGKRYLAHIRLDDNPENPRDGDQLTTMACWHRRYKLGDDVVGKMDPEDFWQSLVRETVPAEDILKAAMDDSLTGIRVGKIRRIRSCWTSTRRILWRLCWAKLLRRKSSAMRQSPPVSLWSPCWMT